MNEIFEFGKEYVDYIIFAILGFMSFLVVLFSAGVTYYFLDNEYYFARAQVYGEYDDAERFAFFSKAVLEILPDLELRPDVINCNDWQTALIPVYYNLMFASRPFYTGIKTVSIPSIPGI